MKLDYFVIVCLFILIVSMGTVRPTSQPMVTVPAMPKGVASFFVKSDDVPKKILEYSKVGYIVKTVSSASGNCSYAVCMYSVVVMELY